MGLSWRVSVSSCRGVYVLIVSILLLNLLIALMGDSYAAVKEKGLAQWKLEQALIITEMEGSLMERDRACDATVYLRKNTDELTSAGTLGDWDTATGRFNVTHHELGGLSSKLADGSGGVGSGGGGVGVVVTGGKRQGLDHAVRELQQHAAQMAKEQATLAATIQENAQSVELALKQLQASLQEVADRQQQGARGAEGGRAGRGRGSGGGGGEEEEELGIEDGKVVRYDTSADIMDFVNSALSP